MAEFRIGILTFASKQEALSKIKNILYRSPSGVPLTGENAILMRSVLACYDNYIIDDNIQIAPFDNINLRDYRSFRVINPDGSTTPFPYTPAVKGR
jgi:hypothetical protein